VTVHVRPEGASYQLVGWVEPFAKPIAFAGLTVEKKLSPTRMFR
jgi:hypothetical protein